MLNPDADISYSYRRSGAASSFWLRILNDEQLCNCGDLEKLLVGCEIIAALDGIDLLTA